MPKKYKNVFLLNSKILPIILYNILIISIFLYFFDCINNTSNFFINTLDNKTSISANAPLLDATYDFKVESFLSDTFNTRNQGLLNGSVGNLYTYYNISNDNSKYSLNYEFKRISYLMDWAIERGIIFTSINSIVTINNIQRKDDRTIVKLNEQCTYTYMYNKNKVSNTFHLTIPHILTLSETNNILSIDKDYYVDFLNDGLSEYTFNLTENQLSYSKNLNVDFPIDTTIKKDSILRYEKFPFTDHTANVINLDSNGYPLISSSTLSIENMPYDLGWNIKNIKIAN